MNISVGLKSPRTSVVNVRIDERDKHRADLVMAELGITPSEVIRLLYRQITLQRRLPFDISLPAETLEAIEETESGGGTLYSSVSELKRDLGLR